MADLAKPVRSATLSQQIADELRNRIVTGEWAVGTKIPAEPVLMQTLGVSRSTVREALRSLVHTRMLEARAGDGTYVRSDSTLEFALRDRIAHADLREAVEIRAMLEQHTARLAAQRCTPADAGRLRELLATAEADAAQADSLAETLPTMQALFDKITAITGNRLLAEIHKHLAAAIFENQADLPGDITAITRMRSLRGEFIEAVCANDPDRAEDTVRRLQLDFILGID
ncbi:FadR/GntR family transcriptional regulator [Nocardia sp. NPDC088792]|uniref:FadR/GntR family transcriptional regulator n=1 Tax=Nocardia sp. NPDC088792 TaxID=3364332 RepID=UPI00381D6538